uniref:ADP-ribosyl cyclase/cyclic ADP-ribose hydrolase n=2 Tax=Noccaea caerulescens TaxID=107243 RepID=A0A1J3II94_NOCCA
MVAPSSSTGPQVFINFRGELRNNFVTHLLDAFKRHGINSFIDSKEKPGVDLKELFERIKKSTVALAILSSKYTESHWCLDELVKIKECVDLHTLRVIPIFYNLKPETVKELDGDFGLHLWNLWKKKGRDDRILKWDAALQDVRGKAALILEEHSDEAAFVDMVATHVKNFLDEDKEENSKPQGKGEKIPKPEEVSNSKTKKKVSNSTFNSVKPGEQRLKQLEEKLAMDCDDKESRIIGVVGMAGIGKTYLAEALFEKLKKKVNSHVVIRFDSEKWKDHKLGWLQKKLAKGLLDNYSIGCGNGNPLEFWKDTLVKKKVVILFDNVSDKKQIKPLLGNCNWIKEGSRIIITTRDKSLLKELTCDLYHVPKLNDTESFELFRAQVCTTLEGNIMEMSRKFVDYAGGNPFALKEFGDDLCGKEEDHWKSRLEKLTQCSNSMVRDKLRICYDELNEKQKDAFLDIAYFFRSQEENYVRTLLDSFNPESAESGTELRDLTDKFLIDVCDGRVEMHDLFCTLAKELVETNGGTYWLFPSNCPEFTTALAKKEGRNKVRGIVLDMSEMEEKSLDNQAFVEMTSLQYLKVYSSTDPGGHNEAKCNLNLPDELEFPKDNILRYLHWVKFPRKELPSNLEPKNLIDLRLPYSNIATVWNCAKVAPKLRWVDLSHSSKLTSLLGLSKAPNLLRLNLEGCTSLKELPKEMKELKNLIFLNVRGCTSLVSLPAITIDSLKTLILSGCSNLQTFKVISKNLETLHLNGTAISRLPQAFSNLHKLILLNLKECKNLVALPDCLWKLKSLQELKLSGCAMIESFPHVKEKMENLQLVLLDGTSITEMPRNIINLSFLRHLSLSRNDKICSLEFDMGQMCHLKWLEVKYCKNLTSLLGLPPNLQCLNAYGCVSLRTVASPLAFLMPTNQIHYSTFIFTNCHKLEQVSKSSIISYVQKKSELMSDDRYNQDFVFKSLIGTCFPGCDVPAWFNHQAFGSVLKLEFPRDWNEGKLNGIALCCAVSFKDYKDQNNGLQVKCTSEFTNVSSSRESFTIGGWSEPGDEPHTIETDHIFVGYTTLFNSKKRQQFTAGTEVSLTFEVTNGTSGVEGCKVMKCGFTLVYEPEEAENLGGAISHAPLRTGSFAKGRGYLSWNRD